MEPMTEETIMKAIADTLHSVRMGLLDEEEGKLRVAELEAKLDARQKNGNGHARAVDDWPDPVPLPTLPDAPPWNEALLPEVFRPAVMDIAERMQCAPDYIAAAFVVATGSVIGRSCSIRPKREDDWTVAPNLWGAAIGRPSELKTPSVNQAFRPLRRLVICIILIASLSR